MDIAGSGPLRSGRAPVLLRYGLYGAGAAVLALLPWLVTGMRLPLQNLWGRVVAPDRMPVALLPLSQYAVALLFGLLVGGWALAGILGRFTAGRSRGTAARWRRVAVLGAGVLAVDCLAAGQALPVDAAGLTASSESTIYLAGLVAVVAGSVAGAVPAALRRHDHWLEGAVRRKVPGMGASVSDRVVRVSRPASRRRSAPPPARDRWR